MRNLSFQNEFNLHENEPAGVIHFHMNCFVRRLVLTCGKRQPGNSFLSSLWMALFPYLIESLTMLFVYVLQVERLQAGSLDDFLSCSKGGEIITKTSVREIGNPLTKKGTGLVIVTVV